MNVIKGEASETDSENETPEYKRLPQQLLVVDGEASESDDDIVSYSNTMPANMALPVSSSLISPVKSNAFTSILQNKLVERNMQFWLNINTFIQSTFLAATKQLAATDQLLLHTQVTLQSAARSVQKINDVSAQVLEKSSAILTSNFLADIKHV